MGRAIHVGALLMTAMTLSACSTVPDVRVAYYLPKASSKLTVVHSLTCNQAKSDIIVSSGVLLDTSWHADYSRAPVEFRIKDTDGMFTAADMEFHLTEDGRLETVNSASTGAGKEIVSGLVGLAKLGGIGALTWGDGPAPCELIEKWGEDKKVITLTLTADANVLENPSPLHLRPVSGSEALYHAVIDAKVNLPIVAMTVEKGSEIRTAGVPASIGSTSKDGLPLLKFSRVRQVPVTITVANVTTLQTNVLAPFAGPAGEEILAVPVSKASMFGKQEFDFSLHPSGMVKSVHYGRVNGTADGIGAFSDLASVLHPTAADRVSQMQDEIDLIVVTRRLAVCRARPDDCK